MPTERDYEGIIVFGMPRSGTTLLRRLLNGHPNICCPPETNLLNACSRLLYEEHFTDGLSFGIVPGLGFSGIGEEEVLDRVREFAFSFFRDLRARSGKKRWAEKTAIDAFHTDNIAPICGDRCRYVCMFRHPLDVVCSLKEMSDKIEMYISELHTYVSQHAAPLEAFAHAWLDVNQRLLAFISDRPESCITLRYEDLVQNTAEELARVLEFLDEGTDTEALITSAMSQAEQVGLGDWKTYEKPQVDDQSVGRWSDLSEETVGRIATIVNPIMAQVGYEPIDIGNEPAGEDSRHRYQIARMVARMQSTLPADDAADQEPDA